MPTFKRLALIAVVAFGLPSLAQAQDTSAEIASQHLTRGMLAAGDAALQARLATNPADRDAHLGLGLIRFARAVETLGQGFYRHGLRTPRNLPIPFLRMPVPENPNPEPISYDQARAIYARFLADLAGVEAHLARQPAGDAKVRVDIAAIQLDFNGNGRADPDERLSHVLQAVMMQGRRGGAEPFPVAFDTADAIWLRGYTHVLSAMLEFVLAHDWRDTFDATAHLFFEGARGDPRLQQGEPSPILGIGGGGESTIADVIAFAHLIRWPLSEPQRLLAVRDHLKQVVALSRLNWAAIQAETDDELEWVPSPQQRNAAIQALDVTPERVTAWFKALDSFEAVLDGRKLVPHWRFAQGFDLSRAFTEPRNFDLVLWITGHAAVPYLRAGETISRDEWQTWQRIFGGNFLGYAIWFN
jgi:hypothetical protein